MIWYLIYYWSAEALVLSPCSSWLHSYGEIGIHSPCLNWTESLSIFFIKKKQRKGYVTAFPDFLMLFLLSKLCGHRHPRLAWAEHFRIITRNPSHERSDLFDLGGLRPTRRPPSPHFTCTLDLEAMRGVREGPIRGIIHPSRTSSLGHGGLDLEVQLVQASPSTPFSPSSLNKQHMSTMAMASRVQSNSGKNTLGSLICSAGMTTTTTLHATCRVISSPFPSHHPSNPVVSAGICDVSRLLIPPVFLLLRSYSYCTTTVCLSTDWWYGRYDPWLLECQTNSSHVSLYLYTSQLFPLFNLSLSLKMDIQEIKKNTIFLSVGIHLCLTVLDQIKNYRLLRREKKTLPIHDILIFLLNFVAIGVGFFSYIFDT